MTTPIFMDSQKQSAQSPEDFVAAPAYAMPSYMINADAHRAAVGESSLLESIADTINNAPEFLTAALISGANQIYNIPANIGNLAGGEFAVESIEDWIADYDKDLLKYYENNKDLVDFAGFMVSAALPGTAGIKALRMGQASLETAMNAGKFGSGYSKAFGLLIPKKQKYLKEALQQAANETSVATLINKHTIKAAAAGLSQATLEAAAFEIAVATTMYSSPILENQDIGDLFSNIMWGAVVFGGIGGVLDATKSYNAVKSIKQAADKASAEWRFSEAPPAAAKTYEAIVLELDQLHQTPPIPKEGIKLGEAGPVISAETLVSYAERRREAIENRIRGKLGELSKGDQVTAEMLYNATKNESYENSIGNYIGAVEASRMSKQLMVERKTNSILRKKPELRTQKDIDYLLNNHVAYTRNWGDGIGDTYETMSSATGLSSRRPNTPYLVDTLKDGEEFIIKAKAGGKGSVRAGSKVFNFTDDTVRKNLRSGHKFYRVADEDLFKTQARTLWVSKLAPWKPEDVVRIGDGDIPMLEKAYKEFDTIGDNLKVSLKDGQTIAFNSKSRFLKFLEFKKKEAALELVSKATSKANANKKKTVTVPSQEEIAAAVNVRPTYLSGRLSHNIEDDIFATEYYSKQYSDMLRDKGLLKTDAPDLDVRNLPQHTKVAYESSMFGGREGLSGHILENMTTIKAQQKIYIENTTRVFNDVIGEESTNFIDITSATIKRAANSLGAGAKYLTAESSNYGSLASLVAQIGRLTSRVIEDRKDATLEVLEPLLYKLSNSREAAIEWATIVANTRAYPDKYILNEAGDALVHREIELWERAAAEAAEEGASFNIPRPNPTDSNVPLKFEIKTKEARELIAAHIEINGERVSGYNKLRTAQGMQNRIDPKTFYPPPVDIKEFPHFAIVVDESVTGTGHSKMLYANSESELREMAKKVEAQNPQLKVRFKQDAEEYYKERGQFEFSKTLNENYIDTATYRSGVSAPYFVPTDPKKIVNDLIKWHLKEDTNFVREAVQVRYEVPFKELIRLGEEFTASATSTFSKKSSIKDVERIVKNPYYDYINTALAKRNYGEYPFHVQVNRFAETAFSKMYTAIDRVANKAKSADELDEINDILERFGYKGAAYDADMEIFANHKANPAILSKVIRKGNSLLATVVLRWDTLNAVNNAISANVLLGAEVKSVIGAIHRGDEEAVGALAKLAYISDPVTGKELLSPSKLYANAIATFGKNTPETEFLRKHGFLTAISTQYRATLDDLSFKGTETLVEYDSRLNSRHKKLRAAGDFGEKWTGNKLAEEFNRHVAGHIMKQLTDVAVSRNLMTEQEALSYINTFINRTQGNYMAAQRPMLFQGPIGQAIGLFQTYQFNLIQQLLRHVGTGQTKDAMTLLGLQATIHGMNGLPGFNAINTSLIGNASGNEEHKDAFYAAYNMLDKQAADWLMYGLGSNMLSIIDPDLKINLYVRGDINPRHVTIVPNSPAEVPLFQATVRVLSNAYKTMKRIDAGADISTALLQGIEHNGLSRPLAGLAQAAQGLNNPMLASYSTSSRGNVIAANDLVSLVNVGRILGGKPMDEAIALDALYRSKAYSLKDNSRRQLLGEAIKTNIIAGQNPTEEQINEFIDSYASIGGDSENFNQWFLQLYKRANTSQVNSLAYELNKPYSQSMQKIMGGYELRDFSEE